MAVLKALKTALLILSTTSLSTAFSVGSGHQEVLAAPPPPTSDATRPVLPVANYTVSFWLRGPNVKPEPAHGSEGPLTTDADVCIVGSGVTGVSAAYHLSEALKGKDKPLKVVVLEAREFCSGATGRNGGHLVAEQFENFKWLNSLFGAQSAIKGLALEEYTVAQIMKILREHDKFDAVDFVPGGRVTLMNTPEEEVQMHTEFEIAKAAGVDVSRVQWLSKEEVQSRWGAPFPAFMYPGNNLWPLKLVSVLFNLAQNASPEFDLKLHTRTPVTAVTPLDASSGRRWSLTTARGNVACSYVLHATNGYASHLLPWLRGSNGIVPTRGQISAVRANSPDALGDTGFVGSNGDEYWFPRQDNKPGEDQLIIIGGSPEAKDGLIFNEIDDSVISPVASKQLNNYLPNVFPDKFDYREPEMEWSGILGFTKEREPLVGPVLNLAESNSLEKYKGQYMSAGYSGHGMPRAFSCAKAVAGMIAADITGTKWEVPEWFPEHYLTTNRDFGEKAL